jgi:hypothetical protein
MALGLHSTSAPCPEIARGASDNQPDNPCWTNSNPLGYGGLVKEKAVQFIRLAIGKCVWLLVTLGWNRSLSGLLALICILGATLAAGAEGGFKKGLVESYCG